MNIALQGMQKLMQNDPEATDFPLMSLCPLFVLELMEILGAV